MKITDKIVEILKDKDSGTYVYVSNETKNLKAVHQLAVENVDLAKVKAKVLLVKPIGIGKLIGDIDEAYIDDSCIVSEVKEKLNAKETYLVETDTLEVWVK